MPEDPPRRRMVLVHLREQAQVLKLAEERYEKLIENAAAEGHTLSEIAHAAGLSPATVKVILRRRDRQADDPGLNQRTAPEKPPAAHESDADPPRRAD